MTADEFVNFLVSKASGDLERRLNEFVGYPSTEEQKLNMEKRLFVVMLFGPSWPSLN